MQLTTFDLQRILFSVNQLSSDIDPLSLPDRTFNAVKAIIATEVISFEAFGVDSQYQGPLWYTPIESVSNKMLTALGECVSDHPCFDGISVHNIRESIRVSDYLSLTEFKRTTIYNEFFRLLGTDRQIVTGLPISKTLMITCSLCRPRYDFSNRDCQIMDLLKPHLTAAFRNAQFIQRLKFENEQLQTAIEFTKYGMITIDEQLNIKIKNSCAAKFLQLYFKDRKNALPDKLKQFVRHHFSVFKGADFYFPLQPVIIKRYRAKLIIRLIYHSQTGNALLLLEEVNNSIPEHLTNLNLTPRETEVIFWISQGKTDSDISILLKISVRTVQKHVEHIFEKLGVETRTAASALANKL